MVPAHPIPGDYRVFFLVSKYRLEPRLRLIRLACLNKEVQKEGFAYLLSVITYKRARKGTYVARSILLQYLNGNIHKPSSQISSSRHPNLQDDPNDYDSVDNDETCCSPICCAVLVRLLQKIKAAIINCEM